MSLSMLETRKVRAPHTKLPGTFLERDCIDELLTCTAAIDEVDQKVRHFKPDVVVCIVPRDLCVAQANGR